MKQGLEQQGDRIELVAIVGEQLSAVTFVQDYVQLHFDGPTITAITWPIAVRGDVQSKVGSPGYRDRLCEFIAHIVAQAYVLPKERLQIDFAKCGSIGVSLTPDSYRAAEAVVFRVGSSEEWAGLVTQRGSHACEQAVVAADLTAPEGQRGVGGPSTGSLSSVSFGRRSGLRPKSRD